MRHKLIAGFLIVAFVVGVVWMAMPSRDPGITVGKVEPVVKDATPAPSPGAESPPSVSTRSADPSYPQLDERLKAMEARHPGKKFDAKQVADALRRRSLWQRIDTVPTGLPLSEKELRDGRVFIHFDSLKMKTLMPGDEFEMPVMEKGTDYRVRIDSVDVHDDKHISWNGHVLGEDGPFTVTFTSGDFLTVGGMSTPTGYYAMQSHGDVGWVASGATLIPGPLDRTMTPPPGKPFARTSDGSNATN